MTPADDARPPVHPVDLDLLADYLAGELDGAGFRRVDALVAAEPAWAASLAALRHADAAVRGTLAGFPAEPMPAAVFDQIMAALPITAGGAGAAPVPALSGTGPVDGARPPGRATTGRPTGRPGHRRARSMAGRLWLGAAALAAVVVIAVVAFLPSLVNTRSEGTSAGAPGQVTRASGPGDSGQNGATPPTYPLSAPPGAFGAQVKLTASGIDYTFATLSGRLPVPGPTYLGSQGAPELAAPPQLERLTDPAAFAACLAQVRAAYGLPDSVDFARYLSEPALVMVIPSAHRVVVTGPDCGLPGPGADVIATAPTR